MNPLERAIHERPYPQLNLRSEVLFSNFLRDRNLRIGRKGIRNLVADDIIKPITYNPDSYHPFQIWPISEYLRNLSINLTSAYAAVGNDKQDSRI